MKDSIGFPKEIFGSPKGVTRVSKDSIGFPKEIFRSPKGVSQIRIGVRQMMYVDQLDVFRCPNRSNMAAQISGFSVGFSGGNPEQTVKQPIDLVATSLIREVATKIHGLDRFHGNGPYCNFLTEKEPIRAQGFAEDWLCHIIRCLT